MPRFFAHLYLAALVVAVAVPTASQQPHGDSGAATAKTLQSIERAWLNAEKDHDAAAFEEFVADDWIAITPDGKSQTKAERAAEIKASHITSATVGDMKVRVFGDTGHRQR
jgi:ketosteroid isomerase-like protein